MITKSNLKANNKSAAMNLWKLRILKIQEKPLETLFFSHHLNVTDSSTITRKLKWASFNKSLSILAYHFSDFFVFS